MGRGVIAEQQGGEVLRRGEVELRLFTLLTTIGTPIDVTSQELSVESLFPADDATERWFRAPWPHCSTQ